MTTRSLILHDYEARAALGVGEKPMLGELAGIVRTRMGVIKILEREVKDHAAEVKRLTYNYDQCKSRLDDMSSEVERLTAERYAAVLERDAAVEALRRLLTLIECASNLPDEAANRIEAFGVDEGVYHASRIIGEAKAILAKIKGERG